MSWKEIPDAATRRIGAPVARPGAVYCIGLNYAAHAREGGSEPPKEIIVFLKPSNTVVGPDDDVSLPPRTDTVDWEAELAIVIGARAWRLADADAGRAAIAGYTVANDLSERTWQLARSGGQWSKGKGAPGFCPLGTVARHRRQRRRRATCASTARSTARAARTPAPRT